MDIYSHKDANVRKTWFLFVVFLGFILALGWGLSYYYGNFLILYVAVIVSIVMNVGSYWFSDKIVLALAGARPVSRDENKDVWNVVENLSITAGLPMPKVYIIDDAVPNAFATGRNVQHAVVAVTSGLLTLLSRSELEGVIAHELSHIGNRDMLLSTAAVVLVGFVTLLSDFFLRTTGFSRGRERRLPPVVMILGLVLVILSPIIASLLRLAISRKREFLADASGVLLTRFPEGLASALEKISAASAPMRRANHATAHLYISDPFGLHEKQSTLTRLFMTHPPIEERIAVLRGSHS
ncbi:MAG: M48 family metallopeptidase [Candidatus Uhrbacteria bacterium]|nr:M48 family metallopeptidase [Candidatus Uhrbacteria bacterium]